MGSFSFRKTENIIYTINDDSFEVPYTQELLLKIEMLRKKAGKCVEKVEKAKNEKELLEIIDHFYRGSVDEILGNGAFETIFAEKEINLVDLQDLIFYLGYETEAYSNRRYAKPQFMPPGKNKKKKSKKK